jgi:hypothetical protein
MGGAASCLPHVLGAPPAREMARLVRALPRLAVTYTQWVVLFSHKPFRFRDLTGKFAVRAMDSSISIAISVQSIIKLVDIASKTLTSVQLRRDANKLLGCEAHRATILLDIVSQKTRL